ncbi:MAG: hypothetical protein IJS09_07955, partial [Treponema sp.]|nr:hypothetical protein [Treponema sp.]
TTGNTFLMPKGNVTVSAVFEEGTHGTTEFAWGYFGPDGFVTEATIYDGLTTVNLQQGQSYQILKYDNGYSFSEFILDNNTYNVTIPYSGGTGTFPEYGNGTSFKVDYNGEEGFYDITMTDAGNGKWSVSILKTVGVIDNIPDQTYTGSEITPEPLVLAGSLNLTKGTDYEYSYSDNTNVGTATVTVTFKGDYASLGSVEKTFTILPGTTVSAKVDPYSPGTYYTTFYDSTTSYVADCEVYYVTANADGKLTLVKAEGNIVKAGEGVILKATRETVTLSPTNTSASYDSLLTGSDSETTVENVLVLSLGKDGVRFYNYSGTVEANKAYLAQ